MSQSFVPDFKYDVFVSYAHVDDRPVMGADIGWVSALQRNVFALLDRRLGRRENYAPFIDHRLRGNHEIDDLLKAVDESATLVVILSPGWCESTYCHEELKHFLNRKVGNRPRDIFIVEMLKVTSDNRPKELPNTRAYRFWYEDSNERTHTYGDLRPKDPELEYAKQLDELAQELADHLKTLRAEGLVKAPVPPSLGAAPPRVQPPSVVTGTRTPVVLAEVTDDLVAQRAEVSRYLRDENFDVLPEGTYRYLPPERVEEDVRRDLKSAVGFVQLLGETPGHTDSQMPCGMPGLQYQVAKNRGARIVQWRKPDIDLSAITLPEYRALVSGETAKEMALRDFCKFAVGFLRPPVVAPPSHPEAIFINADQPDLEVAQKFKENLEDQYTVVIPRAEGDPEELRTMMDEYLTNCESVVMLYVAAKPTWIDRQLWRFNKVARNRERPPHLLAVLEIPPDKPKPSVGLPGLMALRAQGIEAALTLLRQHLAA